MIAHLSLSKRSEGHKGGVPKFAWYMERELGARLYSWQDYEGEVPGALNEVEKAVLLGTWLWGHSEVREAEAIVVDGFWSAGFPDEAPVTIACHGTWGEAAAQMPGVPVAYIHAQAREFKRFPVVAVSEAAGRQCWEHYGVNPVAIVNNAVDLDAFAPDGHAVPDRPVVIHVANAYGKGGDVLLAASRECWEMDFEYLGAELGEEATRFAAGDLFAFPSRHEGNSYALLEAMATGLPVVGSPVGLLETTRDPRIGVVLEEQDPRCWANALRMVWKTRQERDPRGWLIDNGITLENWASGWRQALGMKEEVKT